MEWSQIAAFSYIQYHLKKMPPSDKNQPPANSETAEEKNQECSKGHKMDSPPDSASSSASFITKPGQGTITNIPLITASQPTLKCSINDQMKTFDPGEDGGFQRLTSNLCGNSMFPPKSSNSIIKNSNKNYKAGSKINKLADMLAKRSQNVVEVTQSNTSDIISDITSAPKVENPVTLNNVSNSIHFEKSFNSPVVCLKKTAFSKELDTLKKSRRKSVPHESCNLHQMQIQSTSKSCSDFMKLFSMEENGGAPELNALEGSLNKLQTDESTKKKTVRKNLKSVELSLILPEKKRRSSMRTENLVISKIIEKTVDIPLETVEHTEGTEKKIETLKEIVASSIQSPMRSVNSSTKIRKDSKVKQRKSKRLVETSTQTTDIEFISVIKSKPETEEEKPTVVETVKPTVTYKCLYCTQTFALGSQCKAHEKTHSQKTSKQFIKCQYCSKKLPSLEELKSHCIKKHPSKYSYCVKCDERFTTKEELHCHNRKIHFKKNEETVVGQSDAEATPVNTSQEKKNEVEEKQPEKKVNKQNGAKTDLKIDVSYDSSKKSSVSPRNVQKSSPKENKTEEHLLEMEMLFYSHLSGNIQENLTNHLDGKLDKSGNPVRTDQISELVDSTQAKTKSNNLLSVVTPTAGVPDVQISRAPSPYQTRSKTPNPLPLTAKKFKKLPNWQQKFWEKYNFPTNYRYEHRFWDKNYLNTEKSAFYLKDLSCLDIKTQLTMRENIKKLDNIKMIEENTKQVDKLQFPYSLSLLPRVNSGNNQENKMEVQRINADFSKAKKQVRKEETKKSFKSPGAEVPVVVKTRRKLSSDNSSPSKKQPEKTNTEGLKMMTRRQSSIDLMKDGKGENSKKRKGSLDMSGGQRMSLRRQTSLDNLQENDVSKADKNERILAISLDNADGDNTPLSPTGSAEISGEWVRPRSYLCGTCCTKFTNLWELEDHKWVSHPNVWCTHYEFEDEKIDKLFQRGEEDGVESASESSSKSNHKLTDLYKRYLLPHGSLKTAKLVPNTNYPEQCTKCKKHCMNSSEMHKHMLDCGGDTTWFLTMYSSPMSIKRKWRPFGSRRRKQIGKQIKRNIPNTSTLRPYYQHRIRTKPGDVESIQKMLANLPEKRARRAINFDEIKTRSQATIHSNRLLRKRFKTTFTNNFLKLKNMRQKQKLKQGKKEGSSKSATDASSESTPVGSPKRKNKLKENLQNVKEETLKQNSRDSSTDKEGKSAKKVNNKNNTAQQKTGSVKIKKGKGKNGKHETKTPSTRSKGPVPTVLVGRQKSPRTTPVKEEKIVAVEKEEIVFSDSKKQKEVAKTGKKLKKKGGEKVIEIKVEAESGKAADNGDEMPESIEEKVKTTYKQVKAKKMKVENTPESEESNIRNKLRNIHGSGILNRKQIPKEKTELLKRMKKKFKNSKRILELKEAKKVACASRRSQRIKSLQMSDDGAEPPEAQTVLEEVESCQKEIKLRKVIVNLENAKVKKSFKVGNDKSPKSNSESEDTKESTNLEGNARMERRLSRSLSNSMSLEEKPEVLTVMTNGVSDCILDMPKRIPFIRLDSKSADEVARALAPARVDSPVRTHKKAYRIQNVRILRPPGQKPETLLTNGPISLLKKNQPRILRGTVSSGEEGIKTNETLEVGKFAGGSKNNDLEMPILAKVEPIHGKNSGKTETEIPVLMPFEKESNEEGESSSQKQSKGKDVVSFQVIKKKRKTSKEITPLKIVKKVENVSLENESGSDDAPTPKRSSTSEFESILELGKSRKRKNPVICLEKRLDLDEKRIKNADVKKYFLGICPNEIDKGKKDGPDESGSDSEPLITLVTGQPPKGSTNEIAIDDLNEKEEEIIEVEKVEKEEALPKEVEEIKVKVKSKNKIKKICKMPLNSPSVFIASAKNDEKIDNLIIPLEKIQVEEGKLQKAIKLRKKIKTRKKKIPKKTIKRLRMTVTLKEPTLKIVDKTPSLPTESKWTLKVPEEKTEVEVGKESTPNADIRDDAPAEMNKESILRERRSRRVSKEIKSSNEFIIDDPLILVDELWSDLDSDSDSSKKKTKKGKKKIPKKKTNEEKRISDVKLEELLRNFGENKDVRNAKKNETVAVVKKKRVRTFRSVSDIRKVIENRAEQKSNNRLSLKLFRFNNPARNYGNRGERLSDVKKALKQKEEEIQAKASSLPDLPFLAAEIKENPIQVIQCHAQKSKGTKKGTKKIEARNQNIHFKISLPLECISNMAILNNNHLTELIVEETPAPIAPTNQQETTPNYVEKPVVNHSDTPPEKDNQLIQEEPVETVEMKNKSKRSEVIDKIFYCEICKTYYYSSSQLKIHKLSNRHKLKESELLLEQEQQKQQQEQQQQHQEQPETVEIPEVVGEPAQKSTEEPLPVVESNPPEPSKSDNIEVERLNDDTLEMPTLEGPFIENPLTRVGVEAVEPAPAAPVFNSFGFSQESLKDIQRAIGCTDEEMLILTLLGENTIEIENDILDLDSCKSDQAKTGNSLKEDGDRPPVENEKANGVLKVDLKQRMTSALACLVNKAVLNLLQKYETSTKSAVNPEALSFLGKLSSLSRRKNILQLNELLKKQNDGESSLTVPKELEKKEPTVPYKYQCTICGSRFEKASTRECHISRSHKGKAKKVVDDAQVFQSSAEEDWNDSWNYDTNDDHLGNVNSSQFWCSDCGINFLSPQEVLEHQKLEHQAGLKETERTKDAGPLQSSTIGSSDEIIEGKKTRRRPKPFSSEELDQQRIIANNELRKLDRKFSNKNKTNKIKWGMDALKFTVEKENKMVMMENEKEVTSEDVAGKPQLDMKNIDLVPKLNLSRTSNIPEFKVIQKTSFKSRFQKIIDNKLKRKTSRHSQQDGEVDETETEVMLVPVVVKKKNKKQKPIKYMSKKEESEKVLDVYDFNESESEGEPIVFSHVKKPAQSPTKLKLVKVKEGPSKNKADSTTKDLAPDDYDSEDSLPLSIVKKSKPEEDEDEKDEKTSEDGVEKSEGILEQVEYLIEQLENETGSTGKKKDEKECEKESDSEEKSKSPEYAKEDVSKSEMVELPHERFRVSLANKFIQLQNIPKQKIYKNDDSSNAHVEDKVEATPEPDESTMAELESSQSTFDEEDSMPLVLMSKKTDAPKPAEEDKKFDENVTDVSTTASDDVRLFRAEENKSNDVPSSPNNLQPEESLPPVFSSSENDGAVSEKSDKPFETLNGNVIYSRNESMSDFASDISNDGLIHSNFDKTSMDDSCTYDMVEKEDAVILCSKDDNEESNDSKIIRKRPKSVQHKKKENDAEESMQRKKKRFPLLTATIEENNFRKSESPKLNKEVIVRKIWNRRKLPEDSTDDDGNSLSFIENEDSLENTQNDESQTEIEKEIIVKKIWSRKKLEHDGDYGDKIDDKFEDVKINQTEISDEVVIKCGPKTKPSLKRRKSRNSTNESSKETIMRKIWSGKCFQTKAALKTYDSDMLSNCKENDILGEQTRPKKRGRPAGLSTSKRNKTEVDDEDDLDSLLEEIEREQLEKAIRLEFLQLRRSEKANVDTMKEGSNTTVGLFAETDLKHKKEISDRKRKKVRKKIKHPRQSVLKRRKFLKKPVRRILHSDDRLFNENGNRTNPDPITDQCEKSVDKDTESFEVESKIKNRKHKKHRHKHHHHKHKHKKSKHHKCIVSKHKSKHKFEGEDEALENADSFTILEKICQDIPNQIENELQFKSKTSKKRISSDLNNLDPKIDDVLMTSYSFESNPKNCNDARFDEELSGKERFESGNGNVYDFVEEVPEFGLDDNEKSQNVN